MKLLYAHSDDDKFSAACLQTTLKKKEQLPVLMLNLTTCHSSSFLSSDYWLRITLLSS